MGDIEISLSDLLSLRPGSKIHLGSVQELDGKLYLGNSELGKVSIELKDDQFVLHFDEVALVGS